MTVRTSIEVGVDELQRALADDAGFEAWYRRSLPRVYAYLMSRGGGDVALAEDLTQQTFVAAIDQRSRFDGRSDTITWLCGIARHKLVDHWRRMEREDRRLHAVAGTIVEPADPWDVELDVMAARDVLGDLGAHHRAALTLRYVDDLPVADVAAELGRTVHATEALLVRARSAFRNRYEEVTS